MERQQASRLIKIITAVWFVLGLVIAGITYAELITLDLFQILFPAGFALWVILIMLLTQIMNQED